MAFPRHTDLSSFLLTLPVSFFAIKTYSFTVPSCHRPVHHWDNEFAEIVMMGVIAAAITVMLANV